MMNVFVKPSGRRIEPFGDLPGEVFIQNRPLSQWQDEMIAQAGLFRVDTPQAPCLQIPDTLFTTPAVLRRFVDAAAGRNAVLVLAASKFGEQTTPIQPDVHRVDQGWRFDQIRWLTEDPGEVGTVIPEPVVIDPQEKVIEFNAPGHYLGDGSDQPSSIALPRDPVMTIHHWVHILWANQAAGASEFRSQPKWKSVMAGAKALLRARSLNKWRLLSKLNQIGRGCDIHPSAIIEGSTLGDGVTVGPFARILFSNIGDGVTIMPGAQIEASTLGERSLVCQQTVLRLCVLYPGAAAGQQLMQQCVLGRDVVTTLASYAIDLNFEKDISVPLDGQLHSTGTRFLGSAFGHRARVGTGFWMASGRMIPNDSFLVRHPDDVITRIPADLPARTPLFNHRGTLTYATQRSEPQATETRTSKSEPPPAE